MSASTFVPNQAIELSRGYRGARISSTIGAFMLMFTTSVMTGMGFTIVPGTAHFGVSTAQYLLWLSIFTLTAAVMYTFVGALIRRFGIRVIVTTGGLVVTASIIGMAFAPNIYAVYVLALTMGIGWGGCSMLSANTVVNDWYSNSQRRGTVLGIVAMGLGVGGLFIGLILPAIASSRGLTGTYLFLAGWAALVTLVPGLFLLRKAPHTEDLAPSPAAPAVNSKSSRMALAGSGGIIVLLLAATAILGLEGPFSGVQAAVYQSHDVLPATVGILTSVWALAGLIAKPLLGVLADKLGMLPLYIILAVMFLISLPGIAMFGHLGTWVFFLFLPIAALALSIQTVVLPLIVMNTVGRDGFAIVYGFTLSAVSVATAIAAPLWGLSFDITGSYNTALMIGGISGFIGLSLAFFTLMLSKRRSAARAAETELLAAPVPV